MEQKNWTHVRKLLGWDRYDSLDAVETINDLFRNELRLWLNLYRPSVKLVKKTRVASSSHGDSARVAELKNLRESLDPFQLTKIIDQKLERIYKLANRRLSPKPKKESQIMASRRGTGCGKAVPLGNPAQPAGFPLSTATTPARLPLRSHLKWRDNLGHGYILEWLDGLGASRISEARDNVRSN